MSRIPFKRRTDADERIESARQAIAAILPLALHATHRRFFLRATLWMLTEAEVATKHRTRFRSEMAWAHPDQQCQHDHVFQLAKLIERLEAASEPIQLILLDAIACTVTEAECFALTELSRKNPDIDGWARYRLAGTTVIDSNSGEVFGSVT